MLHLRVYIYQYNLQITRQANLCSTAAKSTLLIFVCHDELKPNNSCRLYVPRVVDCVLHIYTPA